MDKHKADVLNKLNKRYLWDDQLMSEGYIGADDFIFLLKEMSKLNTTICGDGCIDNLRAACTSNKISMKRYQEQKEEGCCGECDIEVKAPSGLKYIIGHNCGH
jgi:hypothetical protein